MSQQNRRTVHLVIVAAHALDQAKERLELASKTASDTQKAQLTQALEQIAHTSAQLDQAFLPSG